MPNLANRVFSSAIAVHFAARQENRSATFEIATVLTKRHREQGRATADAMRATVARTAMRFLDGPATGNAR
jgi:hypothetical protein